jgi:hypothetical protein
MTLADSSNCARGDDRDGQGAPLIAFRDVAARAGVNFRFDKGSRRKHDLPEIMGGGVALFDADGDGRLDIYLCNGGPIEPAPGKPDPPCRLYRNLGTWRFADITDHAAAPGPSYAMGAAVGDFDGDGSPDLLVTGWGDQRLYKNLGSGRFEDVTMRAGLTLTATATSTSMSRTTSTSTRKRLRIARPPTAGATTAGRKTSRRSPIDCTATMATAPSPTSLDRPELTGRRGAGWGCSSPS